MALLYVVHILMSLIYLSKPTTTLRSNTDSSRYKILENKKIRVDRAYQQLELPFIIYTYTQG